jgi:hypothetical protein
VTPEDARANYTGPTTVLATAAGQATVSLKAMVKDISALITDPAYDGSAGSIANARVSFVNRATGEVIGEVPVVAGTDPKVGTATLSWPVNIGSAASVSYTIGIKVKNHYVQNDSSADSVVTIRKP